VRGGNWINDASYCRSAFRYGATPANRARSYGYRVVLEVAPKQQQ
jgi:formylglycine-generating enzyme required for sulfatase activity